MLFHSCRCRRCRRWRVSDRSVGWVVSWVCGGSVCGFGVGESLSLLPPTVLLTDDVGCLAGGGSFEALDGELALVAGAGGLSSSSSAHPFAIVCICEGGRTRCIIVEQPIATCRSSSHACNYNASCTCKSGAAAPSRIRRGCCPPCGAAIPSVVLGVMSLLNTVGGCRPDGVPLHADC